MSPQALGTAGPSAFCFLVVPLPGPLAKWAPGVCKALAPFLSTSVCPCLSTCVCLSMSLPRLSSLPLSLPLSLCMCRRVSRSLCLSLLHGVALPVVSPSPCPSFSPSLPSERLSSPSLALPTLSGHTLLLTLPWWQPQAQCKRLMGRPWAWEPIRETRSFLVCGLAHVPICHLPRSPP